MADHYPDLTEAERAYWDIYTRLRALSDWDGFTEGQDQARAAARAWLVNQRKEIWRCAEGKKQCDGGSGWEVNKRRERYAQLADENLNGGSCRRVCQLPTGGGTPSEKAKISEREMWWLVASVDEQTKGWRQSNADWLTSRRKQVWHLGEDEGWDEAERELRYENLCVATKTGQAYTSWADTHDTTTGAETSAPGSSSRAVAVARCRQYLGVNENPPDSNRGNPQPDGWQNRVYGSSGVPWCACFSTCMAWDAGVVGSSSAGVQVIVDMARKGQGMFRGWTTDPGSVLRGDMAVIGCSSCHVGMVVDSDDACHTIEGNTSPGSEGSQYNGGCVAERHRSRSEIVGWALVDYP
jgi:hypothetical protein